MRKLLLVVGLVVISLCGVVAQATAESKEEFNARTQWWREARFGMFIHWGLYAIPADVTTWNGGKNIAEWYMANKLMQPGDYEKFASQFNPVKFDAKKWVKVAKDAGMKYIVITSKHHDGFGMFDSKLTKYDIVDATPYKKDPMKDLARECKKQGLKLCFYHSIMDWHNLDYLPRRGWEGANRPAGNADINKYIDYMKGQLTELLTNYGPVGIIWFDGSWEHTADEFRSAEVNAMIRSLQPGIIINDRNKLPEDYSTPEQSIPASEMEGGRLWETCMTMNDTWGYAKNDTNWKSSAELIRMLCDIASKGGNLLLNIGPTADGVFPEASNERLKDIAAWMKVNSKSIYGTTASPFSKLPDTVRCTQKGNILYLQVFEMPAAGIPLPGLKNCPDEVRVLGSKQRLSCSMLGSNAGGIVVTGQLDKANPAATVLELRFSAKPDISK